MLRNHLDALALIHPRFKLSIIVDEGDAAWDGPTGPASKTLLASILPPPTEGDATTILVAGSEPFQTAISGSTSDGAAGGLLGEMRYLPSQVHSV